MAPVTDGLAAFPDPLSWCGSLGTPGELSSPQPPELPRVGRGETEGSTIRRTTAIILANSYQEPGVSMNTVECLTRIILVTTLK